MALRCLPYIPIDRDDYERCMREYEEACRVLGEAAAARLEKKAREQQAGSVSCPDDTAGTGVQL